MKLSLGSLAVVIASGAHNLRIGAIGRVVSIDATHVALRVEETATLWVPVACIEPTPERDTGGLFSDLAAAADRTLARMLAADFVVDLSLATIPAPAMTGGAS